jgi:hypothetical protein
MSKKKKELERKIKFDRICLSLFYRKSGFSLAPYDDIQRKIMIDNLSKHILIHDIYDMTYRLRYILQKRDIHNE